MASDMTGAAVKVGDQILIPAVVTQIFESDDFTNIQAQTNEVLPPTSIRSNISLNSRQVVLASAVYADQGFAEAEKATFAAPSEPGPETPLPVEGSATLGGAANPNGEQLPGEPPTEPAQQTAPDGNSVPSDLPGELDPRTDGSIPETAPGEAADAPSAPTADPAPGTN